MTLKIEQYNDPKSVKSRMYQPRSWLIHFWSNVIDLIPFITGTPSLSVTIIAWRPSTLKIMKKILNVVKSQSKLRFEREMHTLN